MSEKQDQEEAVPGHGLVSSESAAPPAWILSCTGSLDGDLYHAGDESEEELTATSIDEAIRDELDLLGEPHPETLKLTVYRREKIDIKQEADRVLEDLLLRWDEELGDPDGDGDQTPGMQAAAIAFVAAVASEYTVWSCDACGEAEIDIPMWKESKHEQR